MQKPIEKTQQNMRSDVEEKQEEEDKTGTGNVFSSALLRATKKRWWIVHI